MGKMRVHELAKELGKENKDILEALEGLGVQVSSHMSTVDEEVCEKIKKKFEKKDGAKEEGKPKKKNIIQVFRPQNSKTGMVRPGQRPGTARPGGPRPQGGAKAPAKGGRAAGHSPARKPEGAVKPQENPGCFGTASAGTGEGAEKRGGRKGPDPAADSCLPSPGIRQVFPGRNRRKASGPGQTPGSSSQRKRSESGERTGQTSG